MVREYRGSSIYFEPGARKGRFVGVWFDDDQTDEGDFDFILEQSLVCVYVCVCVYKQLCIIFNVRL